MKILGKISAFVLTFAFVLGITGSDTALAATSPTLVGSAGFSVLGATTVTCTGATNITGDVGVAAGTAITGFPTPCTVSPGTTQSNTASAIAAQADNLTAFGALNAGANADASCIGGILADNTDLRLLSPLLPGLYCSAGNFLLTDAVGTDLVLTGAGPWVFKTVSGLTTSPGASVSVPTPADACNVWWRVGSSAVLNTTTSFIGNILALTDISLATGATLNGRAMVQTGQVTLDANTISGPTCVTSPTPTPPPSSGGGGGGGSRVVAPRINVVKVPNPLALPNGPGSVTYTYTLRNIGEVPVSNITMDDDMCSSVSMISGDLDNDSRLDINEEWIFTCTTTLTETTNNTVTATGQSNGVSVTDRADATVVVGIPTIPLVVTPPPSAPPIVAPSPVFGLPSTGFPPQEENSGWNIIILAGIFMAVSGILYIARKKHTTSL